MTPPAITDAKDLAYRLRASGVLVLAIGGGQFGSASYGMTRHCCRAMAKVLEQIHTLVGNGTIVVPDELRA